MNEPVFQNLHEALSHLQQAGYKVSRGKIYRDKDKNFIRVNPDGTVSEAEVRAYASTLERKTGSIDDLNDVHIRRAAKDVELRDMKIKKMAFELAKDQGKYIERVAFESELAARAVVFETGLKHAFNAHAGEWIALVCGKRERVGELLEALNHALDQELSRYANIRTFQVMFENLDEQ